MTTAQILERVNTGEITVAEAATLIDANTPDTVKVVTTQYRDAKEFLAIAKPIKINSGGLDVTLTPREYQTGSYGWSSKSRAHLVTMPDGKVVKLSNSINLIVSGSKPS